MHLRQYYISDIPTWSSKLHVFDPERGSQWLHLIKYTTDQATLDNLWGTDNESWAKLPEVIAWQAAGGQILISGGHNSELHADEWRSHPSVVLFPHSTYEPTVTFGDCVSNTKYCHKRFKQCHLDTLTAMYSVGANHCVWDLHDAVTAINPGVRLTRPY